MTPEEISNHNRAVKNEIAVTLAEQIRIQKMPNGVVLKAISSNPRPTSNAVLEGLLTGKSYRIDTFLSALAVLGIKIELKPTYNAPKRKDTTKVSNDIQATTEAEKPILDMPDSGPDDGLGEEDQAEHIGSGDSEHGGRETA
jgi:hypothetical protein